jgi:hypothetical protein
VAGFFLPRFTSTLAGVRARVRVVAALCEAAAELKEGNFDEK